MGKFDKSISERKDTTTADLIVQMSERTAAKPAAKAPREHKSERANMLMKPSVKKAAFQAAAEQGVSFNEYVNTVLEAQLRKEGRL